MLILFIALLLLFIFIYILIKHIIPTLSYMTNDAMKIFQYEKIEEQKKEDIFLPKDLINFIKIKK